MDVNILLLTLCGTFIELGLLFIVARTILDDYLRGEERLTRIIGYGVLFLWIMFALIFLSTIF